MSQQTKTMNLKCPDCKRKIMKYKKIGKGFLLRCYKTKIKKNNLLQKGNEYFCKCGLRIGIDENSYIKMLVSYKFD